MKLYNYHRSGTSFRVRIALNLKGLPFDYVPVALTQGEHRQPAHQARSLDGLVPVLDIQEDDHTAGLSQSMAIIEYLDERYPEPPLLPDTPLARARVRAMAQTVACDIHPINNLRILKYLADPLQLADAQRQAWYNHWVLEGLRTYERRLAQAQHERLAAGLTAGRFSWGDQPSLADCCLIPQLVNGQRFGLRYNPQELPLTLAVFEACMALPAFQLAHPSQCPDHDS